MAGGDSKRLLKWSVNGASHSVYIFVKVYGNWVAYKFPHIGWWGGIGVLKNT